MGMLGVLALTFQEIDLSAVLLLYFIFGAVLIHGSSVFHSVVYFTQSENTFEDSAGSLHRMFSNFADSLFTGAYVIIANISESNSKPSSTVLNHAKAFPLICWPFDSDDNAPTLEWSTWLKMVLIFVIGF